MLSPTRTIVGVGAVAALLATPFTASAQDRPPSCGGPGTVRADQMPDDVLGYAGFHPTGEYTETMGTVFLYGSACADSSQYSEPTGHRGREYPVTGFAAGEVEGPAGEVGADVYQYSDPAAAEAAFSVLRDIHDGCEAPNEFGQVPQFLPETGLSDRHASASFTSHAGDYLAHGGNDTYSVALSGDYIVVGGYETPSGPDAPVVTHENATAIADQAVRAAFDSVYGLA